MALIYFLQEKYEKAEPLFTRALVINEQALGKEHPVIARTLKNYVALLKETNRDKDAEEFEDRIAAIEKES